MSAEYRVRSRNKTTPKECVMDGKSAIRWIKSNAESMGIDPEQVLAGGHVAAATGTLKGFDEPGEDISISARPDALVLFNPVYDNSPEGFGYSRVKDYWKAFSPMHNIDEKTPPTVVFLGSKDKHIPVATLKNSSGAWRHSACARTCIFIRISPHGFFNLGRGYFDTTVQEMNRFLVSLGYLPEAK